MPSRLYSDATPILVSQQRIVGVPLILWPESTNPLVILAFEFPRLLFIIFSECFYNRDGAWYYAGVYKAFRMDDLTVKEWEALSNEVRCSLTGVCAYLTDNIPDSTMSYQGNAHWAQEYFATEHLRDVTAVCCWCPQNSVSRVAMHWVQQDAVCDNFGSGREVSCWAREMERQGVWAWVVGDSVEREFGCGWARRYREWDG